MAVKRRPDPLLNGRQHLPTVPEASRSQTPSAGQPTAAGSPPESAPRARGQEFRDLLLLGALACQAPAALLSVRQHDASWATLSHGFDTKDGLEDKSLFEAICSSSEPVEFADVAIALPRSPVGRAPHSMRWVYGVGLWTDPGAEAPEAAVVVLDRWLRRAACPEERALLSLGRCLSEQLAVWRGAPARTNGHGRDLLGAAPATHEAPFPGGPTGRQRSGGMSGGTGPGGDGPTLLRSQEVARLFDVTERTVINWAASGRLPSLRTIGGHLRFRREDVLRLLAGAGRKRGRPRHAATRGDQRRFSPPCSSEPPW